MASVIDIVVWIFAGIGLIGLIGVMLYYIAKAIKEYKPPEQSIWPDASYMEKIGAQCPTGWVYSGQARNGQNICKNYYNVDVQNESKCYSPSLSDKIKYFDNIKDWEKCQNDPGNCKPLKERCNWIKDCGPTPLMQGDDVSSPYASWIGVSNKC